jgi:hypothetical protein
LSNPQRRAASPAFAAATFSRPLVLPRSGGPLSFTLGLVAGAVVAVVGVLMGLGLLSLRSSRTIEYVAAPAKKLPV